MAIDVKRNILWVLLTRIDILTSFPLQSFTNTLEHSEFASAASKNFPIQQFPTTSLSSPSPSLSFQAFHINAMQSVPYPPSKSGNSSIRLKHSIMSLNQWKIRSNLCSTFVDDLLLILSIIAVRASSFECRLHGLCLGSWAKYSEYYIIHDRMNECSAVQLI